MENRVCCVLIGIFKMFPYRLSLPIPWSSRSNMLSPKSFQLFSKRVRQNWIRAPLPCFRAIWSGNNRYVYLCKFLFGSLGHIMRGRPSWKCQRDLPRDANECPLPMFYWTGCACGIFSSRKKFPQSNFFPTGRRQKMLFAVYIYGSTTLVTFRQRFRQSLSCIVLR